MTINHAEIFKMNEARNGSKLGILSSSKWSDIYRAIWWATYRNNGMVNKCGVRVQISIFFGKLSL